MIFGFTVTSKRGKGDLCKKKTVGFTLLLTRGTKVSSKTTTQVEDEKPPFVTCRSEYVKTVAIENATAVQFFKPEEGPTQLGTAQSSMEEGHSSDVVNEKASEN
jgi:hypothetical protein